MKQNERPQAVLSTDDRKTSQLCGHEYAGARCMRRHGHEGRHECLNLQSEHVLRWD